MATNKTINPTNVTVQIPAMADKPNQSVNSNCIDKAIDGINALNSKIERTYTRINEVNGLNVYLTKHGCANQLYIQGTLTNAVTGSDTIDVCSTSDLTGLNFTDYIAGVEFNTGKVIGFFSSGGYVKMRINGGMSAGEAFSGHIVWC